MATADRPTTARRTGGPRKSTSAKSTSATPRKTTGAAGTKSARAASRAPAPAATGRRQPSRTSAKAPAAKAAQPARGTAGLLQRTSVTVPVVNLRVPLLAPRVPDVGAATAQTRWAAQAVRANLPSRERILYYGGLGVLASVGALEWPVAAALGVGVWVAGRAGQRRGAQTVSA